MGVQRCVNSFFFFTRKLSNSAKTLQVLKHLILKFTVMILSFRTDMPGQTVQTQIRLLLEESKKISNDQDLIQSDPISCPQNQKGNN